MKTPRKLNQTMKTLRKLSNFFFIRKFNSSNPKTLTNFPIIPSRTLTLTLINRSFCSQSPPSPSYSNSFPDVYNLISDRWTNAETRARDDLCRKVAQLGEELIRCVNNDDDVVEEQIHRVLDEKGLLLFRIYPGGEAFTQLLDLLVSLPSLAIKVANWRRRQADYCNPMTPEEYAKLIWLAGKMKNLDLSVEIFVEACNKRIKTSSTCNALMAVYMRYGLAEKCQSLFRDMKKESACSPTIITYNILLSVFGRSMLLDHMDATFQEVKSLNISPNLVTYNNLIAGYVTAWMWDNMEKTFKIMQESTIEPNLTTHSLMLRGYAHSGQLEKMEEVYSLVKNHVNLQDFSLTRAMICAYCQSSDINRVKKVKALLKLIPEDEYRGWLNVVLIKLYAKESLLDEMESSIEEALKHNTSIVTVSIMRCIISNYFRNSSVDRLSYFIKRAEVAGWRICRSLYHCKMVMYSAQNRLGEMESVLDEMGKYNIYCSKKTLWILYKAYSIWGERNKVDRVIGLMCKHGYEIPSSPLIPS